MRLPILFLMIFSVVAQTNAFAEPARRDPCLVLGKRADHPRDIAVLCIDPSLSASGDAVVGTETGVSLYELDPRSGLRLAETLTAKVSRVHRLRSVGKWLEIKGAGADHAVWLEIGAGSPPRVSGTLTYLSDRHAASVGRYVWEPSPTPADPWHCRPGRSCH